MKRTLSFNRFMLKQSPWIYVVGIRFLKNSELYNVASFVVCDQWLLFQVELVALAMLTFRDWVLKWGLSMYLSVALQSFRWNLTAFSVSRSIHRGVRLLGRGISPSQGRYLHTRQHKQNKRTHTLTPWVGFEPSIPAFERKKTVRQGGHCDWLEMRSGLFFQE
jgi:hypothetical protein